jgi:hypothetical protein
MNTRVARHCKHDANASAGSDNRKLVHMEKGEGATRICYTRTLERSSRGEGEALLTYS